MTNDKTVTISRELAEVFAGPRNSTPEQMRKAMDELRALLAKSELADHCKQCAEAVKTWPESKRDCLGKIAAPVVERQEPVAFWYWPKDCPSDKAFTTNHKLPKDFYEVSPLYASPPAPVAATHYEQMVSDLSEAIGNAHEECRSINRTKLWKWLDGEPGVSLTDCFGEPDSFGVEASQPAPVSMVLPERMTRDQALQLTDYPPESAMYWYNKALDDVDACLDKVKELNQ